MIEVRAPHSPLVQVQNTAFRNELPSYPPTPTQKRPSTKRVVRFNTDLNETHDAPVAASVDDLWIGNDDLVCFKTDATFSTAFMRADSSRSGQEHKKAMVQLLAPCRATRTRDELRVAHCYQRETRGDTRLGLEKVLFSTKPKRVAFTKEIVKAHKTVKVDEYTRQVYEKGSANAALRAQSFGRALASAVLETEKLSL